MAIRVNRGILHFEIPINQSNKILHIKSDAPQRNLIIQNEGYPCLLLERGVLTVEAAFCGTAFFLAFFSLLYLFQMLFWQNKIELELIRAVSQYESYGSKLGTADALFHSKTLLLWDDDTGTCYVRTNQGIPFMGSRVFQVKNYQQIKYNAYEGKSMASGNCDAEEMVYISEYGRVYHKKSGCVYLNPGIESYLYKNVADKRNLSGGKYGICSKCCRDISMNDGQTVFLTPYGDCCHISRKCSSLLRNVRQVYLSEVGGMPPCSKCGEP